MKRPHLPAGGWPRRRLIGPRDISFMGIQSFRVYGPFELSDRATLEHRLLTFLRSRRGRLLLRTIDRDMSGYRPFDAAEATRLYSFSGAPDLRTLCTELHALPMSDHPVDITLTDRYIGFRDRHVFLDGASGSRYLGDIMAAITDTPCDYQLDEPHMPLPLAVAIARAGLYRRLQLSAALASLREHQPPAQKPEIVSSRPNRAIRCEVIDTSDARTFADDLSGDGPRISVSVAVTIAILRALEKELDPSIDIAVNMAVDARRYIGSGRAVPGNFAPALGIGSLRSTDWTPSLIGARLSKFVETGAPLASVIRGAVADFRPPPFNRKYVSAETFRLGRAVTISHLQPTPVFASLPWSSDTMRYMFCSGFSDQGLGLTIYTERSGSAICLSIVDDSDLIDVESFFSSVFSVMGVPFDGTW